MRLINNHINDQQNNLFKKLILRKGCNFCPFGVQKKSESESEHSRLFFLKNHTPADLDPLLLVIIF